MVKGYMAGAVAGGVLSVVAAGAISVVLGVPGPAANARIDAQSSQTTADVNAPATDPAIAGAEAPSDVPPVRFEEASNDTPLAPPPPDAARRPGTESEIALSEPAPLPDTNDDDTIVRADTAPATAPQVAPADSLPATPAMGAAGTDLAAIADTPVSPSVQSEAPRAPTFEPEPSIATEPAQPPVPQVPPENSGLVVAGSEAPADLTPAGTDTAESSVPQVSQNDQAEPDPQDLVADTAPDAPQRDQIAESAPESAEPAPQDGAPEVAAVADPEPAPQSDLPAVQAEEGADRPAIGTPAMAITDRAPAVTTRRLPTIGTDTATPAPATDIVSADSALPPLERFAVGAAVDPDLPLMSILLIDDGTGPLGPDALDAFPMAITFAIDPTLPDAAARMTAYRALGFEVMALASVPDRATPSDVEVGLAASVAAVPEAVALLESPIVGLQDGRAASDQAAQFSLASGHGLVFQSNGLNTAAALAARDGVAAASVFRDIDGDGQDPRTIRRFLDGAAFRARQDGGVIVMGRLRPDTISALLLWGLQDRAAQVSLVPVSAVLTR